MNPIAVAGDAWLTERGGPARVLGRQRERFADLLAYARSHSPFYAERYRSLPLTGLRIEDLPPVCKPELMEHFNEWVTDRAVRRSDVERWVAVACRRRLHGPLPGLHDVR
jgi:hypothetical protein